MIVRVLGDRQYEVDDDLAGELEELERRLDETVSNDDEEAYGTVLDSILETVRSSGRPLDPGALSPSDLTVPPEGSTIADLKALLDSETDSGVVAEGA